VQTALDRFDSSQNTTIFMTITLSIVKVGIKLMTKNWAEWSWVAKVLTKAECIWCGVGHGKLEDTGVSQGELGLEYRNESLRQTVRAYLRLSRHGREHTSPRKSRALQCVAVCCSMLQREPLHFDSCSCLV